MDKESRKLEQLRAKHDQLKKKIRDWENAVFKTEGRKPNREDMKSAPSDIQGSYRDFVKIRKYLEDVVVSSGKKVADKSTTPGKIFQMKHRPQLQRTDQPYLTRTPAKIVRRTKAQPSSSNGSYVQESGSCGNLFKKLFNASKLADAENKAKQKELSTKVVNNDSNDVVERHALLPDKHLNVAKLPKEKDDGLLIDENTITNLIQSLSDSISNDEDTSRSTNFSFGSHSNGEVDDDSFGAKHPLRFSFSQDLDTAKPLFSDINSEPQVNSFDSTCPVFEGFSSRKRPARIAFSVSPEKPKPKNFCPDDNSAQFRSSINSPVDEFEDSGFGAKQPETENMTFSLVLVKPPETNTASNDDDTSRSTNCSSHNESEDSGVGRKRSSSYAFTPSPEKPVKNRKFFKSSRADRTSRVKFSAYKPILSPLKKPVKKNIEPSSSKVVTNNFRKVTRAASRNVNLSEPFPSITDDKNDDQKDPIYSPEKKIVKKPVGPKKKTVRTKKTVITEEGNPSEPQKSSVKKSYVIDIFDEGAQPVITMKKRGGRRFQARNQTLESKIASGKGDDNYVRINTKKKVFVRGHKKISVVNMKRLDWKQRKSNGGKEMQNTFTCHKCGEKGHFAKFCTKDLEIEEEAPGVQDDSPFPTLEEAARMVNTNSSTTTRVNVFMLNKITEEVKHEAGGGDGFTEDLPSDALFSEMKEPIAVNTVQIIEAVPPFFNSDNPISTGDEMDIIKEGLVTFGYEDFRPGQKEAIIRILKGLSTLLILSTGSGKSLCYQLPAYLYQKKYPGAMTLCVSPLVSLMEDQVQGIPPFLNAACLHSGMTSKQKADVLDKVRSKKLHILLVSPEAVCGGLFGLLRGSNSDLPRISFACIDEVHCVSQWSHNFRPSYLQLCKILREKLGVGAILGLTATATETTSQNICEHLAIDPSTTIRGELIPKNLNLSVSRDVYKDEALLNLLRGERFRECDSIIIYCTRREECERIAALVRVKMQEASKNKVVKTKSGTKLSSNCEAYHAGMTARRRKNVQNGFMAGDIRIVVATVAFGMGIDKSDIRTVIHYNMPSTFESYVQEIGRAGRDGLPAHCHLFLDNSRRNDLCELKRHVYANSVDRPTIRKLLRRVFQPCKCGRIEKLKGNTSESTQSESITTCPGHEVSFSIEDTVNYLDLPKENITTLLCYLELGEKKWIEILPLTYETCKIQAYGGAKLFKTAASRCPPLAVAIALQKEKNKFRDTDTYLEFNVIEAAATVGWNSGVVKKELKNLEWTGFQLDDKGNPTKFRKSGLLVEFSSLAYRVKSSSLTDEQADEVLNSLHGRNLRQEQTELYQLQRVYQALLSVSFPNVNNLCDSYDEEKSDQLKKFIYEYFTENSIVKIGAETSKSVEEHIDPGKDEELRRSIRQLIDSNKDINFTTRSIARIFQGISSPCFPADVWYRNKDFWRRYLDIDFHTICRIASEEL